MKLTIGKISSQAGINVETIRYYERENLVPLPERTEGGHRIYDEQHLRRLIFIRRGRELGFSLDEIRTMLSLVDGGNLTCAEVKKLTVNHLKEVREKIADLQNLERTLSQIAAQCSGKSVPACPIIDALNDI